MALMLLRVLTLDPIPALFRLKTEFFRTPIALTPGLGISCGFLPGASLSLKLLPGFMLTRTLLPRFCLVFVFTPAHGIIFASLVRLILLQQSG